MGTALAVLPSASTSPLRSPLARAADRRAFELPTAFMYEELLRTLPESALACRALYDSESGGYWLPPRSENRRLTLAEVPALREQHGPAQFDCVEAPVADLLFSVVVNTRSRLVLETGTSRGFSTSHLAAATRFVAGARARVVTLDIAPTPQPFFADSDLAPAITALQADSLSVVLSELLGPARFDFMFFDSLHTYAHLSGELARHLPLLKVGGLFALHDTLVYDDLGLVVLWMMASRCFEVLSLPTHRSHGEGRRSPGVSLFRKLSEPDAGDLRYPSLADVVEGERESLLRPQEVVARTGSFFRDARYAARDLDRGPRLSTSPALLDPVATRPPDAEAADPDLSQVVVERHLAEQAALRHGPLAPGVPLRLDRLQHASEALREREAEWWNLHGLNEAHASTLGPAELRASSTQRWVDKVLGAFPAGAETVHIGYGGTGLAALLGARHWDLRSTRRWKRIPRADAYVFDRALYHLATADIKAVLEEVREQARPGATIVLIEPVCFPGNEPDAKDRALAQAMDDLVQEAAQRIGDRAPEPVRARIAEARAVAESRWWGERPRGPSPLEQPFVHRELEQLSRQHFRFQSCQAMQSMRETSALVADLSLLFEWNAEEATSIARDFFPRLDVLERTLLSFPTLPDTSWYLMVCVASN